jgi:hypothetical protein
MVDEGEVSDTMAEVTRLGGRAQASAVAPEAVEQAEQALAAASTEATAQSEAPSGSSSGND